MSLAISLFGEETNDGIARVGEITGILATERPDVWFEVGRSTGEHKVEIMETSRPIHRLRGFALTCEKQGAAPKADEVGDVGYPLLEQLYDGKITSEWYPHLIDHADDDGYYVPADFAKPVNSFYDGEVMSVGSSQRLLAELNSIKRFMWGEEVENFAFDSSDGFAAEKMAWCTLYGAAKQSIAANLIIRFRLSNPDFD